MCIHFPIRVEAFKANKAQNRLAFNTYININSASTAAIAESSNRSNIRAIVKSKT